MNLTAPKSLLRRRILATVIDYSIVILFFILYMTYFGRSNSDGGITVEGWPSLIPIVFWLIYIVIAEAVNGATWGHYCVGLKVVSLHGTSLHFRQVLKRRICDAVEIGSCFGLIAFILVKNTTHHQRLGDIVAKTVVVNETDR